MPSKSATKAVKGLYPLSTKRPAKIPPTSETMTSFVIMAKKIVSRGIAIEMIPYSIKVPENLMYKRIITQ
ncbi:hypothetical protein MNB_SV-10-1144 [hydrothermal vent metagenome]|uniref:Uncharacterized protein n=1 Tax=hydrothermal vent metagenome TaxID=652676 RepID=A0A1W1C664_9ZZZZ